MSIVSPFIGDFLTPVGQPLVLSPLVNGLRAEFDQQQFRINGGGVLFDTAFDITRSSSKYVYGTGAQTGQLIEVPPNQPAYQHDPVTGAPLGLSVEGSATNLFANTVFDGAVSDPSRSAPTGYAFFSSAGLFTVANDSVLSGKNTLQFEATSDRCFIEKTFAVSASTQYIIWADVNVIDDFQIVNMLLNVGGGTRQYSVDGIDVAQSFVPSVGKHRISVKVLTDVGQTSIGLRLGVGCAANDTGNVKFDLLQAETGTKPTSYIPTTTSTATRSADIVTSDATTFGDWYRTSGTLTVTAKANVGDLVARLGNIDIIADVDTEKEYSVTYTTDPLATELELLPSGNGYIKQVTFKE